MRHDPEFLGRLARRCRDLSLGTTVERVREHLELMAAELEAEAQAEAAARAVAGEEFWRRPLMS